MLRIYSTLSILKYSAIYIVNINLYQCFWNNDPRTWNHKYTYITKLFYKFQKTFYERGTNMQIMIHKIISKWSLRTSEDIQGLPCSTPTETHETQNLRPASAASTSEWCSHQNWNDLLKKVYLINDVNKNVKLNTAIRKTDTDPITKP